MDVSESDNNADGGLEIDYVLVYTCSGLSKNNSIYGLHTNGWFARYQCYCLPNLWGFT